MTPQILALIAGWCSGAAMAMGFLGLLRLVNMATWVAFTTIVIASAGGMIQLAALANH